jgi:large repetitive protein
MHRAVASSRKRPLVVENLETRDLLAADVAIAASTSRPVYAGAEVTYLVDIRNLGTTSAQNVAFTANLPAGLTFVSQQQTSGPAFTLGESAGKIDDTIATLPAGAIVGISVNLLIPSDTPDGTRIVASGQVSSSTPDSNPANNHFQGAITVRTVGNVSVVSSGTQQAKAGNQITYNIAVANNGPSDAQSVSLTDALPAGLTLISQTQVSGTPFVLSSTGNTINDSAAVMKPGTFARFTVVAQINPGTAPGTVLTNTATVAANDDGSIDDNQSSVQTKVLANSEGSTSSAAVVPATASTSSSASTVGSSSSASAPQAAKLLAVGVTAARPANPEAVDLALEAW